MFERKGMERSGKERNSYNSVMKGFFPKARHQIKAPKTRNASSCQALSTGRLDN